MDSNACRYRTRRHHEIVVHKNYPNARMRRVPEINGAWTLRRFLCGLYCQPIAICVLTPTSKRPSGACQNEPKRQRVGRLATQITARPLHLDEAFVGISREALLQVPRAFAQRYNVLAYEADGSDLHVLVPDANDNDVLDRIRNVSGMRVFAREAPLQMLRARIASAYGVDEHLVEDLADAPPAIRAVDELHESAVSVGASDIHVEPTLDGGRVRQRIDGILVQTRTLQPQLYDQIVSRIKLLAG